MEQLSLFDDVAQFNEYGFTVENTFHPSNETKFKKLENTQKVSYNGKTILHLQDNGNGTFNTFSFNEMNFNITLDKAIKIANGIVRRLGYVHQSQEKASDRKG